MIFPILKLLQPILTPILYWPSFYWYLFIPAPKGWSILKILFSTHRPPLDKQKEHFSLEHQKKIRGFHWDGLYIRSSPEISSANIHLAEKPNRVMLDATHYASLPISNPLYLLSPHSYLSDNLPELLMDSIMKNIAIMTTFLIYFIATTRGILRVILYKVGLKVSPENFSNESNSEEKVDFHIRVFATSTSQTSDSIAFDTDAVPFIIHNLASGAIFSNRS